MWISKEEAEKFHERIKYKFVAKILDENEEVPITEISDYDRIWYLVNMILIEKGYFIDGILGCGDISKDLLKKIGKVLRERAEGKTEWKEGHGWLFGGPYRRDFDEA